MKKVLRIVLTSLSYLISLLDNIESKNSHKEQVLEKVCDNVSDIKEEVESVQSLLYAEQSEDLIIDSEDVDSVPYRSYSEYLTERCKENDTKDC